MSGEMAQNRAFTAPISPVCRLQRVEIKEGSDYGQGSDGLLRDGCWRRRGGSWVALGGLRGKGRRLHRTQQFLFFLLGPQAPRGPGGARLDPVAGAVDADARRRPSRLAAGGGGVALHGQRGRGERSDGA